MTEKRMGRPPKPPNEVKRRNIAFRVSETLHGRIFAHALAEGRSVAEEVTRILEEHYAGQDQRAMMREVLAEAFAEHEAKAAEKMAERRRKILAQWTPEETAAFGPSRKMISAA